MLKEVNMYDLQYILRYASLSITQEYLKDDFNIGKQLSDYIPKLWKFYNFLSIDRKFIFLHAIYDLHAKK
jgi:hypothetical protein